MNDIQSTVAGGIESVFIYGNIAVTVLFLCLMGSAAMNLIMYRDGRKAQKESSEAMLAVRDMMAQLQITLALINQKVGHDD